MSRHPDHLLSSLTQERANHLLSYSPDTGDLVWRNPTARAVKAGDPAGTKAGRKGAYRYVSVDDTVFLAHRLIWLMVYGKWPDGEIAARDGNLLNLRLGNLHVRSKEDFIASRKTSAKSGIKGVYQQPGGKWSAQVRRDYRIYHLGTFLTKEDAAAAIEAASTRTFDAPSQEDLRKAAKASARSSLLSSLWRRTLRDYKVVDEWQSLAMFSADVGEGVYPQCHILPLDAALPLGPGNFRVESRAKFDRKTPEGRRAYYLNRNKTDRERYRGHHLMATFSLSLEEYAAMSKAQGDVCAICKQPETATRLGTKLPLAVDHCHGSGEIRELLCRDCNHVLGKFKDDPSRFRAAADYLDRHRAKVDSVPASSPVPLEKER